jgi:predicted Holliday junction resolvase-like endonuclease
MMFFIGWIYRLSLKDICLLILLLVFMITVIWYLNMEKTTSILSKRKIDKNSAVLKEDLKIDNKKEDILKESSEKESISEEIKSDNVVETTSEEKLEDNNKITLPDM